VLPNGDFEIDGLAHFHGSQFIIIKQDGVRKPDGKEVPHLGEEWLRECEPDPG
jgi:hypothetical protein